MLSFFMIGTPSLIFSEIELRIYMTTYDYFHDYSIREHIGIIFELKAQDYLNVKKFYCPNSGKSKQKLKLVWAIRYDGIDYFNLFFYSGTKGIFIPLHRGKNYCTMTLSDRTYKKYVKRSMMNPLDRTRLSTSEIKFHAGPFKKNKQHHHRILFCELDQLDYLQNASPWPLTAKNFSALTSGDPKNSEAHDLFNSQTTIEIIKTMRFLEKQEKTK